MAGQNNSALRFEDVSYSYGPNHPILKDAAFSLRRGMKVTLMGQNGAGKSTLFKLATGQLEPEQGRVLRTQGLTIAMAAQSMTAADRAKTVRDYFQDLFSETVYDIDPRIDEALEVVGFTADHDAKISTFSGGQQARLLLASALIQKPDLLLLDEPTNNLDAAGIAHLTDFLKNYDKTCMVISHDTEFLNSFTDGVLYLDVHTHVIEQYTGTYYNLLKEISARIERENRQNAQLAKKIQANKDKANFFAQKGGKMRVVAKKMRQEVEEMEEDVVEVRREDKTIRPFTIPVQPELVGDILTVSSLSYMDSKSRKVKTKKTDIALRKKQHLRLAGPNGIGKSTLLESIVNGSAEGVAVKRGVKVGYYRQDFSTLDFDATVFDTLLNVMEKKNEETMRSTAAGFLLYSPSMGKKIGMLSDGQKGLVAFARLVLMQPGLLILDEPTNHINFRHLPVIAKALDGYEGAMVLVSHVPEFVSQIRVDETLELG